MKAESEQLVLLALPPQSETVYFVLRRKNYPSAEPYTDDHRSYFFEEHSCPTNWIGDTGSTGVSVMVGWTPKLEQLVARLKALRAGRRSFGTWVFTKQQAKRGNAAPGQRYTYAGAHSAWVRACQRAGIETLTFNDLRAKALTDDEEANGMQAARRKGGHSTEQQTSDYVRHKRPQKAKATR